MNPSERDHVAQTLDNVIALIDSVLGPRERQRHEVVVDDSVGITDEIKVAVQSGTGTLVLAGYASASGEALDPEVRVSEADIDEAERRLPDYARRMGWDVTRTVIAQGVLKAGRWIVEQLAT